MTAKTRRTSPAADIDTIDRAIKIAESFGLTLEERALLFGFMDSVGDNPQYLRRQLQLLNDPDLTTRCELLEGINALLNKFGYTEVAERRTWIEDEKFEELDGKSVKPLLVSGDLEQLKHVFDLLLRIST